MTYVWGRLRRCIPTTYQQGSCQAALVQLCLGGLQTSLEKVRQVELHHERDFTGDDIQNEARNEHGFRSFVACCSISGSRQTPTTRGISGLQVKLAEQNPFLKNLHFSFGRSRPWLGKTLQHVFLLASLLFSFHMECYCLTLSSISPHKLLPSSQTVNMTCHQFKFFWL